MTLPKGLLADLGIDKDAKARALHAPEAAGLIVTDRAKGMAVRVSLAVLASPSRFQIEAEPGTTAVLPTR